MALKKSDLYSSLWESCNQLRGGMDASQYKDYVLFMLFIKYISDKYGNSTDFAPPVNIPKGASFSDMIALKGKSDIGDRINKEVIAPLVEANSRLARSDFPDFDDPNKLGEGPSKVERLGNLISIFQKPELDFSQNRAEHDDILGDAYEFLMRHFATESGKSKGQFYTPSEVSRVIAKVIGITPKNTVAGTTAYDPTCGSGSLLLKIAAEAGKRITLEGQEKDSTTAGLARMNMILHDFPTAKIESGGEGTLVNPKFRDGHQLRTYDYVVANPPFSDKAWSTGMKSPDEFQRFAWGEPPGKQGDYAYLLHIIRSIKSEGKGACILPHGVLFRGNAEAVIRQKLVRSGYLKGIIGLPANLFYGTGIPACIVVLDKENATVRKGVFMIDASKGFIKDGNKNRLREQDIHKIVDVFLRQDESDPRYARMVPVEEIADPKNDYNLNLPRYIDSSDPEDLQDIDGHLRGGIPDRDIDDPARLKPYWDVLPTVRAMLFQPFNRPGYCELKLPLAEVKPAIFGHAEFTAFNATVDKLFAKWRKTNVPRLKNFAQDGHLKRAEEIIAGRHVHICGRRNGQHLPRRICQLGDVLGLQCPPFALGLRKRRLKDFLALILWNFGELAGHTLRRNVPQGGQFSRTSGGVNQPVNMGTTKIPLFPAIFFKSFEFWPVEAGVPDFRQSSSRINKRPLSGFDIPLKFSQPLGFDRSERVLDEIALIEPMVASVG
jgi:type I restriction enzyme M protein